VLPFEIKKMILSRCADMASWDLNSLQNQFNIKSDIDMFKKGWEFNKKVDKYNKIKFDCVYPEWNNILDNFLKNNETNSNP